MWLISGTPALPLDIFVKRCKIERHDAPRLGVLISVSRRLYRAVLSCVKQESLSVLRHSQLSPLLLLPDLMESNAWINKTPAPKCRLLFLARNARPLSKAAIATREATYCAGRCCSDKQEMVVLETLKQHFERNPPLMPRISTKKLLVPGRPSCVSVCEIQMALRALEAVQVIERRRAGLPERRAHSPHSAVSAFCHN